MTITVSEAATYLKVSKQKIYKLLKSGEIKAARIRGAWRTWQESCDEYLLKSAEMQQIGGQTK